MCAPEPESTGDSHSLADELAISRAGDNYERAFREAACGRAPAPQLESFLAGLSERAAERVRERFPGDPPTNIPGYRLIHEVGHGGMGEVYRAFQEGTGETFAVKVLRRGELERAGRLRILFEGKVLECLKHPNIVPILEFKEYEGGAFLVMPLIRGGDLSKRMAEWSLHPDHCPPEQVAERKKSIARLVEKLAHAVAHVHARFIMHRDLKPANVLIDRGEPRICDLGLARRTDDTVVTGVGQMAGTIKYMAPEQLAGRVDLTRAVDIYALGAILYEMLTGHPPFAEPGRTLADLMKRKESLNQPPHPHTCNTSRLEADGDLEWIAMECLYLNPDDGFPNAEALAAALANFAEGRPVREPAPPPPHVPWWQRILEKVSGDIRRDPNHVRRWFEPLRVEAVTCLLAHVGMLLLLLSHQSGWLLWVWLLTADTCLGWLIWVRSHIRRGSPLTDLEWDVMHLWMATTAGEVLMFALHCPLFSHAEPEAVARFYSCWAVMRAVLFFVEGHLFWPRLRVVSVLFVVAAVVMPWIGVWAALLHGGLTSTCFVWMSFQREGDGVPEPEGATRAAEVV